MLDGHAYGQPFRSLRREKRIAAGRAGIARGRDDGLSLRIRLLPRSANNCTSDATELRLASAVAHADHRCEVARNRVLQRIPRILRIDVNQCRILCDRARPLEIQIGFLQIAILHSRIARSRHEHDLRIVCRQAHEAAEFADIAKLDVALSHDGDFLPCPVDTAAVERLHVVDHAEIGGRQKMSRRAVREIGCRAAARFRRITRGLGRKSFSPATPEMTPASAAGIEGSVKLA